MTHAPLHSNLDFYTEIMAKTESRDIKCGGQRCYRLLLPKQSPEAVAFVAPWISQESDAAVADRTAGGRAQQIQSLRTRTA
jgi:hypothetical protein